MRIPFRVPIGNFVMRPPGAAKDRDSHLVEFGDRVVIDTVARPGDGIGWACGLVVQNVERALVGRTAGE